MLNFHWLVLCFSFDEWNIYIIDDSLFTAIGGDRQLNFGGTVFADGGTASAISQRGKQPRDLKEQGLSDDQS